MSKHTKGPWVVRKWTDGAWPEARYSVGPQDRHIAEAVAISPHYQSERVEADFALMAVAPELLEALEGVVSATTNVLGIYGDMEEIYCPKEFKAARAAIAKARGEGDE